MDAAPETQATGWRARLELEVVRDGSKVRLAHRAHRGPLRVQRPFYPEGDAPVHVYVLHPPGGMVGGDRLETQIDVRAGASLLVTTPAAQKLYRSAGATGIQTQLLRVEADGELEWLPAETIAFDGARAVLDTRVELAPGAAFIGWELGCFGRPASELGFASGELRVAFEIWRGGCPLAVDRSRIEGGARALGAPWGYAGLPVYGCLYCVPAASLDLHALATELRTLSAVVGTECAVTALEGTLVVRALGTQVERVRSALIDAWRVVRPRLLGREAKPPRIWAT